MPTRKTLPLFVLGRHGRERAAGLAGGWLYVAVFDTLKHDPPPHGRSQQFRGFGVTWSRDGLSWSAADVVDVGAQVRYLVNTGARSKPLWN